MFARIPKDNLTQADPVLGRIKNDIFHGLNDYSKCFPDLELWQFSNTYNGRRDDYLIDAAIAKALQIFEEILDTLGDLFNLAQDCNITCELHPLHACGRQGWKTIGTLKRAGVNRISIGVQTFDREILYNCARHHSTADIKEAVINIKDFQIATNIDMMIGLPGQTCDSLNYDLSILSRINPDAVEYMRHGVVNNRVIKLYSDRPGLFTNKNTLFKMNLLFHKWMEQKGYEQNGSFSPDSHFFPYRSL